MQYTITCPLCKEKIDYHTRGTETKTHVWICAWCPFVGFEYYTKKDLENLYLSDNK